MCQTRWKTTVGAGALQRELLRSWTGDLWLKVSKGLKLVGLEGTTMLQTLGRVHRGENH